MAVPVQAVFDAFLTRIDSEEWFLPDQIDEARADWRALMNISLPRFLFPRVSLETTELNGKEVFVNDVTNAEIQMLAIIMKDEWVKRCVATWDNLRMLYSNKDFSQANFLQRLSSYAAQVESEVTKALFTYSRSIEGKPYDYTGFAGSDE